jgi:hypothetical protein
MELEHTNLGPIADLAKKALGTEINHIKRPRTDDVPIIVIDKGREVKSAVTLVNEFEQTQAAPYRRRGIYAAADIASLLAWMTRHTGDDAPVFAQGLEKLNGEWRVPKLSLFGIGNYSEAADKPAWHDFGVRYDFPVSDAWKFWAGHHSDEDKPDWLTQAEFAELIENRIYDISAPARNETLSEAVTRFLEASGKKDTPTPTELFKLSRELKVYSNSKVETKIDLQSGEAQLQYSEEHTGPGGRPVKIPAIFYIRIPVFFGQEPILIGVRLRYRSGAGSVSWCYSLFAPDVIVRDEFQKACKQVSDADRTVYLGTPDAP